MTRSLQNLGLARRKRVVRWQKHGFSFVTNQKDVSRDRQQLPQSSRHHLMLN